MGATLHLISQHPRVTGERALAIAARWSRNARNAPSRADSLRVLTSDECEAKAAGWTALAARIWLGR